MAIAEIEHDEEKPYIFVTHENNITESVQFTTGNDRSFTIICISGFENIIQIRNFNRIL